MTKIIRTPLSLLFLVLVFVVLGLSDASLADLPESQLGLELNPQEAEWLAAHPRITVAFDGYFPPYSFLDSSGELEGISVDVFRILEEKLGVDFEIYPEHTWKTLYRAAQEKQVDVVATMVERPERMPWFAFTNPYILKSLVIVTDADNQSLNRRDDLNGRTVALVEDYQYVSGVLQQYPAIEPYYVDTMLDGLRAVSTGKADAAITFLGAGHYLRTRYLLTNLQYAAVYDKDSSAESIAVRSDWPLLQSILNKALRSIPEHTMFELQAKWLPEDYNDLLVEVSLSAEEQAWIKAHPEIRVGVDPEFAPFEFIDAGQYGGMASDYIELLNQRLGVNLQVVEGLTWDEAMTRVEAGEIDVLPAVAKTEHRQQFLRYTEPYLQFHRVIITRTDEPLIFDLSDLAEMRVGVQVNSSHHGYLQENSTLDYVTFDTLEASLLALSGGKVDALVGNVASSTYWIRTLNLTNLKVAAPVSQQVQNLHFAVRRDWPELVSILQKGLDSISPREKKVISEKWLHIEYDPVTDYSLIWKGLVGFSVIIAIIILWNILLNKKVKQRSLELLHYAFYDPLTGLPNRFLIQDRLSHLIDEAKRDDHKLAMLSIDLNDFKKVNETFGHEAGDKVLVEVTNSLRAAMHGDYSLGRLSGDQFLAIITELEDASDVVISAKSLLKCVETPITFENQSITLTASMGIAIYPHDGQSAEELLTNADSATHHSKTQGHGSFAFYMDKFRKNVSRKLVVEEQMRNALRRDEFYVVYQPKIDARSGRVMGFEALMRWKNAKLGDVSPNEFIPIAENNGLIESLGIFVLQTALRALADIQVTIGSSITMAVNLSPRQFRSEKLLHQIFTAIQSAGIRSDSLELEITEGVLMSGHSNVGNVIKGLKALGVTLAMDDFGTGYSSLSYLRRYTFNVLKIDREFIDELGAKKASQRLVSATVAMAHNLDMKVVAEGVETEEQYAILKKCDCDIVQGWLFGKPMLLNDVFQWASNLHGVNASSGSR